MPVRGGNKLRAALRKGGKGGVKQVKVGFFHTARYPDGTPVTNVAAWNEFGTSSGIPPRPFMTRGTVGSERDVKNLLAREIDPVTGVVTQRLAEKVGLLVQGRIQREIKELDSPPNSPVTIKAKGSSNPLLDTGFMFRHVTYLVE